MGFPQPSPSALVATTLVDPADVGTVRFEDGTVAAPSISFTNSPTVGLFNAPGAVSFAAAGAEQLRVMAGAVIAGAPVRLPVGTVGAPTLTFTGDTDTGLYWVTTDALGIATGGINPVGFAPTFMYLIDGVNIALGTTVGTKFGTTASEKLSEHGVTPVVQPAATVDLRAAMIALGHVATGGATPLDLNGGALTTGAATFVGFGSANASFRSGSAVQNAGFNIGRTAAEAVEVVALGAAQVFSDVLEGDLAIRITDGSKSIRMGASTGASQLQVAAAAVTVSVPVVVTGASVSIGTTPSTTGVVRLPNNSGINARDAGNTANVQMMLTNASNEVSIAAGGAAIRLGGNVNIAESANIILGTTTGTQIATGSTQKKASYGKTPIVQPARVGQLTDNSGGTSGGNTIASIVAATDPTAAGLATTRNAIATLAAKVNALELIFFNSGETA